MSLAVSAAESPPYVQHIKTFLNVLCLTRKSSFINWTSSSVEKAFKWSAVVDQCTAQLAHDYSSNICLRKELDACDISCCEFLATVMAALIDPIQSMQRAILTSPLLSWCHNAKEIISVCFHHANPSFVEDLTHILEDSLIQQHKHKQAAHILHSLMSHGLKFATVDAFVIESMAITLLLTLSSTAVQPEPRKHASRSSEWEVAAGVPTLVTAACRWTDHSATATDHPTLSSLIPIMILLHALLLSPGAILTSPVVVKATPYGLGGQQQQQQQGQLEEQLVALSRSPELWGVVAAVAKTDIATFVSIFETIAPREKYSVLTVQRLLFAAPASFSAFLLSCSVGCN
jgi:hypothetical protein